MLTELTIENYRCFERHTLPLRRTTVIVGPNNVGKSTVVEVLRLIGLVAGRYEHLAYVEPPDWLQASGYDRGVRPSVRGMGFDFTTVFHRYGRPPAKATAVFDGRKSVTVYVGEDEDVFGVIGDVGGGVIGGRRQAARFKLPRMSILPQVAPVAREEELLTRRYVLGAMSSTLAPLHFRNQLHFNDGLFEAFRELAESSWPGLQIKSFVVRPPSPQRESTLSLLVRDGDFAAEIGSMGHGLQMWLQVMWFLTRCKNDEIVVLDEPDVYLHADLQRRLMRVVRGRHPQVIIATHSVEILSQVEPDEVLVLDRSREVSRFAGSLPGVQRVIDDMGGIHNIQITRLLSSRRFLLLEGDDLRVLKCLHRTLHPESEHPIDDLPNMSIRGWPGWEQATASGRVLRNAEGDVVTTYCILDRDYHTAEEVAKRLKEAKERGIELHVWACKEIENYLLVPEAIQRVIASTAGAAAPDRREIAERLRAIADSLRPESVDALATEYLAWHRSRGLRAANRAARRRVEDAWKTHEGQLAIIPGKKVLSELSKWSQRRFGVSLSRISIARELTPEEIPSEVKRVLTAIDEGAPFGGGS